MNMLRSLVILMVSFPTLAQATQVKIKSEDIKKEVKQDTLKIIPFYGYEKLTALSTPSNGASDKESYEDGVSLGVGGNYSIYKNFDTTSSLSLSYFKHEDYDGNSYVDYNWSFSYESKDYIPKFSQDFGVRFDTKIGTFRPFVGGHVGYYISKFQIKNTLNYKDKNIDRSNDYTVKALVLGASAGINYIMKSGFFTYGKISIGKFSNFKTSSDDLTYYKNNFSMKVRTLSLGLGWAI